MKFLVYHNLHYTYLYLFNIINILLFFSFKNSSLTEKINKNNAKFLIEVNLIFFE